MSSSVLLPCWCQPPGSLCINCAWEGVTKGAEARGCLLWEDLGVLSLLTTFDKRGESWPVPLLKGEKREYDSNGSAHLLGKSWKLPCWRLSYLLEQVTILHLWQRGVLFFFFFFSPAPCLSPFSLRLLAVRSFHAKWCYPPWNSFQPFWGQNPTEIQAVTKEKCLPCLTSQRLDLFFFICRTPHLSCFLCDRYAGTFSSRLRCSAKSEKGYETQPDCLPAMRAALQAGGGQGGGLDPVRKETPPCCTPQVSLLWCTALCHCSCCESRISIF